MNRTLFRRWTIAFVALGCLAPASASFAQAVSVKPDYGRAITVPPQQATRLAKEEKLTYDLANLRLSEIVASRKETWVLAQVIPDASSGERWDLTLETRMRANGLKAPL